MIQKQLVVGLAPGLESRIAFQFVQKASSFSSDVYLFKNEKKMAAKSIMGVMASAICQGDTIISTANGSDEETAIEVLSRLLTKEFYE